MTHNIDIVGDGKKPPRHMPTARRAHDAAPAWELEPNKDRRTTAMVDLIGSSEEAANWVQHTSARWSGNRVFGKITSGVIWTDQAGTNGTILVPADPEAIVAEITDQGWPLFAGHDPGSPVGKVLAAALFVSHEGKRFIAAVLGLYAGGEHPTFSSLGVDSDPAVSLPSALAPLAETCWIEFATDPREVTPDWVDDVLRDAPLRVERIELSHNTAEPLSELIRVGLVYVALVWNPFVKSLATEAGKDAYANIHDWLRRLWTKVRDRHNPIVVISSHQDGCEVSFLFRGNEVSRLYAAHDSLNIAAAQAAKLIMAMKQNELVPRRMAYEYESEAAKWYPNYAELEDGRLVRERNILVALEQLPSCLSIGITRK